MQTISPDYLLAASINKRMENQYIFLMSAQQLQQQQITEEEL